MNLFKLYTMKKYIIEPFAMIGCCIMIVATTIAIYVNVVIGVLKKIFGK